MMVKSTCIDKRVSGYHDVSDAYGEILNAQKEHLEVIKCK